MITSQLQIVDDPGCGECLEHVGGEFARYIEFPAELADVRHTQCGCRCVANLDLLRRAERERFVTQVGVGHRLEEGARVRTHDRQRGVCRGHVSSHNGTVGWQILGKPIEVASLGGRGGHYEELSFAGASHGQVSLDAASFV